MATAARAELIAAVATTAQVARPKRYPQDWREREARKIAICLAEVREAEAVEVAACL